MSSVKSKRDNKAKSPQEPALPAWAGAAFKLTQAEDILDSYYAPAQPTGKKTVLQQPQETQTVEGLHTKPTEQIIAEATNKEQEREGESEQKEPDEKQTGQTPKTPPRNLLGRAQRAAREISRANSTKQPLPSIYQTYSLRELLPGKALDLYAALFELTHGSKAGQPSIRLTKNHLRTAANILNSKTLNTHERYLQGLGLITRHTVSGDHEGSTYNVSRLEDIGLSEEMVLAFQQFLKEKASRV
jgi:hypothetical protein